MFLLRPSASVRISCQQRLSGLTFVPRQTQSPLNQVADRQSHFETHPVLSNLRPTTSKDAVTRFELSCDVTFHHLKGDRDSASGHRVQPLFSQDDWAPCLDVVLPSALPAEVTFMPRPQSWSNTSQSTTSSPTKTSANLVLSAKNRSWLAISQITLDSAMITSWVLRRGTFIHSERDYGQIGPAESEYAKAKEDWIKWVRSTEAAGETPNGTASSSSQSTSVPTAAPALSAIIQ